MDLTWFTNLAAGLVQHYPQAMGVTTLLVGFVLPVATILLALGTLLAKKTHTLKDDAILAKVNAVWAKVNPFIRLLPHLNLSVGLAKWGGLIGRGFRAIGAALAAWDTPDELSPPPTAPTDPISPVTPV